ncbi:MAG: hypothetical protein CVU64_14755 [Deltaproteobacteria bacterium HGW-Deltaproteobacteria-21]|nr:MAG: hypothetical protein CVU64_14755 [Deltaproteobacteria bacterium HGW-Deltaproteobacteria-21]
MIVIPFDEGLFRDFASSSLSTSDGVPWPFLSFDDECFVGTSPHKWCRIRKAKEISGRLGGQFLSSNPFKGIWD